MQKWEYIGETLTEKRRGHWMKSTNKLTVHAET